MFDKRRSFQGVPIDNREVLYSMQKQIHFTDGRRQCIDFLPIDRYVAPFLFRCFQISYRGNKHARATTCRVVNRFSWFRSQHFCHQMNDRSVCVKFLRCMAAVVGKLFNQILVALAELIFWTVGNRKRFCTEVLYQILQKAIRQPVFIGPGPITKNSLQFAGICFFDLTEGINNSLSNIFRYSSDIFPVCSLRNNKAVVFLPFQRICIAVEFFQDLHTFFIVNIADALKKQQRKDILFICARVDTGTQKHSGIPEVWL